MNGLVKNGLGRSCLQYFLTNVLKSIAFDASGVL